MTAGSGSSRAQGKGQGCLGVIGLLLLLVACAGLYNLVAGPPKPKWRLEVAGVERVDLPGKQPGNGRAWLLVRTAVTSLGTKTGDRADGLYEDDFQLAVDGQELESDHGAMEAAERVTGSQGWGHLIRTRIDGGQTAERILVFAVPIAAERYRLALKGAEGPVDLGQRVALALTPTATPAPTAVPTNTPSPTASNTPASTATPVPPTATVIPDVSPTATFASGGLGLRRGDWERMHGKPTKDQGYVFEYEGGTYMVFFVADVAYGVERMWGDPRAVPVDVARAASRRLIPEDAQLIRTYTTTQGSGAGRLDNVVDVYVSESLMGRFPELKDPWQGQAPGTFVVWYDIVMLGSNKGQASWIRIHPGENR